ERVFIAVEYVYEGSPANSAGLERGDIIMAIDGQELNLNNYQSLFSQSSYTASLGIYNNGSIKATGETISLSSASIEKNPVLHYDVFENNGVRIGYFALAEFIAGENNRWVDEMTQAIT